MLLPWYSLGRPLASTDTVQSCATWNEKNGSRTRPYNCEQSEWREEQQPSYPRVNKFRVYLNHLAHLLST